MHQRVIIAPDQEVTNVDFERMGLWPQDGITAAIRDFLLSGRGFTGFGVIKPAGTETAVEIAAGRYYDGGAMYAAGLSENLSLADFVPFTAGQKVIVVLVVQGREDPGYSEARNNEREVPTSGGGTVVQRVPDTANRAIVRTAIVSPLPGATSISPVRPQVPAGAIAIADILIGTGGIELITRREENEAPELNEMARAFAAQTEELVLLKQEVGGFRNDVAALGRRLQEAVSKAVMAAVTTDIGRIKDRLNIADTGAPYGSDPFLTEGESDPTHVDYHARVEEGLRFPYDNFDRRPVSLFNANDTNLVHAAAGLICPKYEAVAGITIDKRAGSLPLGGTTYQTMALKQLTMSRAEVRYGDYFLACTNTEWWKSGKYDPAKGIFTLADGSTYEIDTYQRAELWSLAMADHTTFRVRQFWSTTVQTPYNIYAPVTNNIQGVLKAQSFIQSQDRWAPATFLYLDSWSANAEISATIIELFEDGSPNPGRAYETVTLAASEFKRFPEKTRFVLPKPTFLRQGRYAVLYAVTGDVQAAYAEGQAFLGGTLFDCTDGAFFAGDLTKDLCFGVEYCRFPITILPVLLNGVNLAGGIHNIGIKAAMVVPKNADAAWQLQAANGAWRDIEDPEGNELIFGTGVAPFYAFRVMLTGTEWVMPIIDMTASEVTVFRAATAVRHISEPQLLSVPVTSVTVTLTVAGWEAARHNIVARLRTGAGYATLKIHDAVVTRPVINRTDAVEKAWTFTFPGPGITAFAIDFAGTTDNARLTFHGEERVFNAA